MSDEQPPERIWLSHGIDDFGGHDPSWSYDKDSVDSECVKLGCEEVGTEYVRADVAELRESTLREALRPFVAVWDRCMADVGQWPDFYRQCAEEGREWIGGISYADLRAARAALDVQGEGHDRSYAVMLREFEMGIAPDALPPLSRDSSQPTAQAEGAFSFGER